MGANLISNKRPTAARRSFCLRVAAHFAVHESAYGQNTTAFDRLCCKSRPVSRRPSAIGNNRIRKRGFVNQYSPFGLVLERLFLAPGPKIFLQQYRPLADIGRTLFDHLVGKREQPRGHLDAKRSRRLKVDDELELAALSGYVRAKRTTSAVIAHIIIGCRQDAGPERCRHPDSYP